MPPRIYAQAPSGVKVTKVQARSPQSSGARNWYSFVTAPNNNNNNESHLGNVTQGVPSADEPTPCFPQYFVYRNEWTDYDQFSVERCSGVISTAKYVSEMVGHWYKVIILAMDENNVTLGTQEVKIEVTQYNSNPPVFTRNHFTNEILDTSAIDTLAMTVSARDNDTQAYNRELYFALQDASALREDPWLYPITTPLRINCTTGEIRLSGSLFTTTSSLRYRVLVADGGSPQRSDATKMTLYIRNISAPRNVKILNTTETSIKVCWSSPLHGTPDGYLISYNTRGHSAKGRTRNARGKLNLTIDQLETRNDDPVPFQLMTGDSQYNDTTPMQTAFSVQQEMYNFFSHQLCAVIEGLYPLTNYAISVRGWASNGRISMARIPLVVPTREKSCTGDTCGHGVCQKTDAPPGYTCICSSGYHGAHCEMVDPCIVHGNSTCRNGGTCLSRGRGRYECRCPVGYLGSRCEERNPCVVPTNSCSNGGTCLAKSGGAFICRCPLEFTGRRCEINSAFPPSPPVCEANGTNSPEGAFDWPETSTGATAVLLCPFGLLPEVIRVEMSPSSGTNNSNYDYVPVNSSDVTLRRSTRSVVIVEDEIETHHRPTRSLGSIHGASRTCVQTLEGSVYWLPPDTSSCRTDEEQADEIVNMTSATNEVNATFLSSSVRKIAHLLDKAVADTKVAEKLMSAISHILSVDESLFDQMNERSPNATDSLLATIHEYTARVPLKLGENVIHRTENLVVEAKLLHKDDLPDEVTFNPYSPEEESSPSDENEHGRQRNTRSTRVHDTAKLWIKVPKSSLENVVDDHVRFQFVSFKNDRIFRGKNKNKLLNRPVLSATIADVLMDDLHTPITYMVPIAELDPFLEIPHCVYWNATEHEWSLKGIETKQNKKGEVFCESNHLTSFSVLLDPIGTPILADMKPTLSVITYLGIALSTIALVVTIVTFALFRSLNRDRSGLIVMNLSLALLLLNVSFLGALFITTEHSGCVVFGALLHYSVAASFSWMLIEAVNMYQMLVTVFPSSETHFMRKRVILGWGPPFLLVVAALIWDRHVYFTEYQSICVISSHSAPAVYYTTYLGPVCFVLFVNIIVFFRVIRVLCQGRPSYKRSISVTLAQIRGAIAIVALLGITWLTGVFAVGHLRMASQFLFCLTTPFQGLIIFWVRVMQSAEARMAWKSFLTTGSTRLRPRPLSSVRTHSSSHHSSSLHTQSTGMTPPQKSTFVSALKAVRRFSSNGSAGLGFMGSSKSKYENNASNHSSTKKLRKHSSNDLEKETAMTASKTQTAVDNFYRRLSFHPSQTTSGSSLSNGKVTGPPPPAISENFDSKEEPSGEANPQKKIEEEPLKDLHHILDSHPFFHKRTLQEEEKSFQDSKHSKEYQESVLIYSSVRKEEEGKTTLQQFSLNYDGGRRNSASTSNLSPRKTHGTAQEDAKRSLESLFPNVVSGDSKAKLDYHLIQDVVASMKGDPDQSPQNDIMKRISSCQKLSINDSVVDNNSYNELTTKSLSDTDINDPTLDTFSSLTDVRCSQSELQQQHHQPENGTSIIPIETQPLTDVVPLNNPNPITLGQRAISEQNIAPNFEDTDSFFRRSVSNTELDILDHNESAKENLLPI